jgi:hypothetical protein
MILNTVEYFRVASARPEALPMANGQTISKLALAAATHSHTLALPRFRRALSPPWDRLLPQVSAGTILTAGRIIDESVRSDAARNSGV